MSKKNKSVDPKEIKRLEKALRDPDLKKKKRVKIAAELAALQLAADPELKARTKAAKVAAKSGSPSEDAPSTHDPAKDEARAAGARHMAHLARVAELQEVVDNPKKHGRKAIAAAASELAGLREATIKRAKADDALPDETETEYQWRKQGELNETDAEIKARVKAKQKARKDSAESSVENPQQTSDEKVAESSVEKAEAREIVDPEAQQPRDRWGRPLILPPGETKAVGYRRTTTFIDVVDDKSALMDWGKRITLVGASAVPAIVDDTNALGAVLESTIADLDKKLRKGKITADEHTATREAALKLHKDGLNALAESAFTAGDGRVAAETGTRIHKLTELYDLKQPLPDDLTESERRDVNAYAAALEEINAEIKLVEQFVVVDRLKVGGTLDRLLRYDSPSLGRRVTAIGDVKTGRVDYGAAKMTRQLAIYAEGKTYDFRNPDARGMLRANRDVGLIFHLPAGSGKCTIYEIDLKAGAEGVKLASAIWAHRDAYKRLDSVFTPIAEVK